MMRLVLAAFLAIGFGTFGARAADLQDGVPAYEPGEIVQSAPEPESSYAMYGCVEYALVDLQGRVRTPSQNGYVLVFVASDEDAACLEQVGARRICAECDTWANTLARGSGIGPIRRVRAAPGEAAVYKLPHGAPILMPAALRGPVAGCDTAKTRSQESWYLARGRYASWQPVQRCAGCGGAKFLWAR